MAARGPLWTTSISCFFITAGIALSWLWLYCGRMKRGREGRREGGKEGRREGGKEGEREGGKEGRMKSDAVPYFVTSMMSKVATSHTINKKRKLNDIRKNGRQ